MPLRINFELKNLKNKSILKSVIAVILALFSYYFLDQQVALFFNQPNLQKFRLFCREITNIGLSDHYFTLSILVIILSKWIFPKFVKQAHFNSEKLQWWKHWGINFFWCLVSSGIVIHLFKFLFGRQRPYKSSPEFVQNVFENFNTSWYFQSLPSGHSQVSFTVATVFSLAFPKYKWLFFLFYGCIAFTRIVTHDHFVSDVIIGATIGHLTSLWTVYWINQKGKYLILK